MSGTAVLWDITYVVPVVVNGWSNVEPFDAMIINNTVNNARTNQGLNE